MKAQCWIAAFVLPLISLAQAPVQQRQFDAVSIKPVKPGTEIRSSMNGGPGSADPRRITYTNVTLHTLLMAAYRLEGYQVAGPQWLNEDRFTVVGVVPEGISRDEFRLMFQNLLMDRFNLRLHNETKPTRTYSLALAPKGPTPALKLAPPEDKTNNASTDQGPQRRRSPFQWMDRRGQLTLTAQRMTMFTLASFLQSQVDRPVQDATGLNGEYQFTLQWTQGDAAALASDPNDSRPMGSEPQSFPFVFQALQQQLGLQLIKSESAIQLLVVDYADRLPRRD